MDPLVLGVFAGVYAGMILGELPGLSLDRTGVALLGAIVLVASGRVPVAGAWGAVDVPTVSLLLGLMVVSAQFRLSGFYTHAVRRMAGARVSPPALLLLVMLLCGALSALLANDIVCLAAAPVLVEACSRRGVNPLPFLLGLALSANAGSAATLIGNPQNMLIGQVLSLSFAGYLKAGAAPALGSLLVAWAVVCAAWKGRWRVQAREMKVEAPDLNRWQTTKGFLVLSAVLAAFLFAPMPREAAALAGAGILLCSRRMRSRDVLGLVDWQLLVLFVSLFVVNHAFRASGGMDALLHLAARAGVAPDRPGWMFVSSVALSNLVSNVPAVMLLLPSATFPLAGPLLALSSTLAGNLLLVGSIANIIVADLGARHGVRVTWAAHARVGVPATLAALALAWGWLWILGVTAG